MTDRRTFHSDFFKIFCKEQN